MTVKWSIKGFPFAHCQARLDELFPHQEAQTMKWIKLTVLALVAALATVAFAQSPEPPLADARISVNTLLREDIFAGFISDDMERFSRGEKNIQLLIEKRPADKALLLAWKAG